MSNMNTVQERLELWASIPCTTPSEMRERHIAWCLYVDARDGWPDGTQEMRTPYRASQYMPAAKPAPMHPRSPLVTHGFHAVKRSA